MSDFSQGPGWWQASDGKWYPPDQAAQPAAAPWSPAPPAVGYAQPYGTPAYQAPKTNGMAIASLVCSLVLCGIGSIVAIVLGHIAKRQIRESGGMQQGDGLATAGLIIGYIGLAIGLVYLVIVIVAIASSDPNTTSDFGMMALGR